MEFWKLSLANFFLIYWIVIRSKALYDTGFFLEFITAVLWPFAWEFLGSLWISGGKKCVLSVEWKDFQIVIHQVYSSSSFLLSTTPWSSFMVLLSTHKSKKPLLSCLASAGLQKDPVTAGNYNSPPFCEFSWSFFHFINTMQFWLFVFFPFGCLLQEASVLCFFFILSFLCFQSALSFIQK